MALKYHFRMLIFVSLFWLLFWVAGLPDYYLQYSNLTMVLFDLAVLPPICYIVYRSVRNATPGKALNRCLWWSFYISIPLFFYDLIYCGIYNGHGIGFLWEYWYLTVYYILPWIFLPLMGWLLDRRHDLIV